MRGWYFAQAGGATRIGAAMNRSPQRIPRDTDATVARAIEDDYTREEFMADTCRDDQPCELCLARFAARLPKENDMTI